METHSKHNTSSDSFHVDFSFEPSDIKAGTPIKLTFRPMETQSHSEVTLDAVHEKYMHLLIVSEDLAYFSHEHPHQEANHYVHEHKFPHGGRYILFIDYAPRGSSQHISRYEINVGGKIIESQKLPDQQTEWNDYGYRLFISEDPLFLKALTMVELSLLLEKEGRPVKDLDNYLGALAHVVIISEDTKEYLHVHPMETKERGPEIKLHTSFPNTGKYKMFVQFRHDGNIKIASFILEVE